MKLVEIVSVSGKKLLINPLRIDALADKRPELNETWVYLSGTTPFYTRHELSELMSLLGVEI